MEIWDLIDAQRRPTGETAVRGTVLPQGRYHLVVQVVIFNTQGEMLIQQRQPFKEGWPNLWDITVGGSAIAGDDSRSAAEREVMEELGLPIDLSDEMPKIILPFDQGFDDIYIITMDVDLSALHLQESEVQAVRWAGMEDIFALMKAGQFRPYHRSLIELLFAMKDSRGAHVSRLG